MQKIYDLMKCKGREEFIKALMGKYEHFLLKENLFSLDDLCEINEGLLFNKLMSFYKELEMHILKKCKV